MGSKKSSPESTSFMLYRILAGLRVLLTLLPQRGYIHPDEYFQSIEVIAGDAFNIEAFRAWEFNVTFPIRSIVVPKFVVGIPYLLFDLLSPLLSWTIGYEIPSPYSLVVIPRIVACALSFVTDYCLYRICVVHRQKYQIRLLVLGSSYVMLVYGTRTFSNSIEMALSSFLLYLVADSMAFSEKVLHKQTLIDTRWEESKLASERASLFKARASLPEHTNRSCFFIATTCVAGVFNRPTFLAFGFIPVFFWLQRGLGTRYVSLATFHRRMFLLVVSALPALFLFIAIDSIYYGHLTWDEIGMKEVTLDNFVVTPFNFMLYNMRSENLADHGLHPFCTHFLVNIPILYNALGLVALSACAGFCYRATRAHWNQLPRMQSIVMLMTASFIAPIVVLSFFPHQEPRFLIPITLPLIFLHAQEVHDLDTKEAILYHTLPSIKWISGAKPFALNKDKNKSSGTLKTLWIVFNLLSVLFFGFLHQGGVYPLANHVRNSLQKTHHPNEIHLVTSHIYSLPQSLLLQQKYRYRYLASGGVSKDPIRRKFFLTEMGSKSLTSVINVLNDILTSCSRRRSKEYVLCNVYVALPSSLKKELITVLPKNLTHKVENVFYPHLSVEALPDFLGSRHKAFTENCPIKLPTNGDKSSMSDNHHFDGNDCRHKKVFDNSPTAILRDVYLGVNQLSLSLIRVLK